MPGGRNWQKLGEALENPQGHGAKWAQPAFSSLGFWGAAVGSSAFFGLAHVDPALIGPAAVSGFVFAWVYWRTGSLRPVVLAHVARNAVALAVAGSL